MDKSLSEYDESLEKLAEQRKQLEFIMQKMGEEWEESGAGIGWLATAPSTSSSGDLPTPLSPPVSDDPAHRHNNQAPFVARNEQAILEVLEGPSPEYLQDLLNVNEALLAQSLSTTTSSINALANDPPCPVLLAPTVSMPTLTSCTPPDTPNDKDHAILVSLTSHPPTDCSR